MALSEEKLTNYVLSRLRHYRRYTSDEVLRPEKITQKFLAEHLECSRTVVANIENKRQQLSLTGLFKICEALGVEPDKILPKLADVRSGPAKSALEGSPVTIEVGGERYALKAEEVRLAAKIKAARKK